MRSLWVAIVAVPPLTGFAVKSFARDAGAYGGGGGSEFRITCPPGEQIVGIDTMQSNVIYRFAPVCGNRKINPSDPGHALQTVGMEAQGSTFFRRRCPDGSVLFTLEVHLNRDVWVSAVGFDCWGGPEGHIWSGWHDSFGGDLYLTPHEAVSSGTIKCDLPEVAVGFYGRSGAALDRIGLICEDYNYSGGGGGLGQ